MENTNTITFLTRAATASLLGVTTSWLDNAGKNGPPFYKISHKLVRYKLDDVQLWLDARKVR